MAGKQSNSQSNKEQDDVVETPVIRTLCRQSSVEMRMYPQQDVGTDSEEEKSDDEDEESAEDDDHAGYVYIESAKPRTINIYYRKCTYNCIQIYIILVYRAQFSRSSHMEESDEEVNFRPKVVNAVLKKKRTAPPPVPPKRMSSLGAMQLENIAGQTHATDEEHKPG